MKLIQETHHECDYGELEEIIRKRFPEVDRVVYRIARPWDNSADVVDGKVRETVEWSIVAEEGCSNDSNLVYELYKLASEDMDESEKYSEAERWKHYREGKTQHIPIHYLLDVLCTEGVLPEGKLLVNVSW